MKKEFSAARNYTIAAKTSGLLLEAAETVENGAAVRLWEANGSKCQTWRLKETEEGL